MVKIIQLNVKKKSYSIILNFKFLMLKKYEKNVINVCINKNLKKKKSYIAGKFVRHNYTYFRYSVL
jgi:hypothetical protein